MLGKYNVFVSISNDAVSKNVQTGRVPIIGQKAVEDDFPKHKVVSKYSTVHTAEAHLHQNKSTYMVHQTHDGRIQSLLNN